MKPLHLFLAGLGILAGVFILGQSGLQPFSELIPVMLEGTWITVQITVLGCGLAVIAAFIAGLAKMYAPLPLRWLAITYIELFRGTSALVQLFWMFFVLPYFGIVLEPFEVGVIALGLNVGAYGAELVRGSIGSVAGGQWEACRALNIPRSAALRRIILPQALVAMIPPWGNLFIELLKASAIVSMITLADLTFKAQQLNQFTLQTTEIFSLVLCIYFGIALLMTAGMRALETVVKRGFVR